MKTAPEPVISYLNNNNKFYICDLYKIVLADGTTLRYANYDIPIVWDGQTWACTGPVFERGKTKLSGKITVDSLGVTVTTDANDQIGGVTWMNLAQNGGFDNATLTLYRCFMSSPGTVIGALVWFGGLIDPDDGGGMEMKWKVRSRMQKANVDYPTRLYYPTCPYVLYEAACGVNRASFAVSGTVTVAGSTTQFTTNLTSANGYFEQGYIKFTSGALAGITGPIRTSTSGGVISMLAGFDSAPQPGDTFVVYPGCDKTPATCQAKFNNWQRNRAAPFIPLKETIL